LRSEANHLEAIVFDWDGTIVDSSQAMLLSYRHAYKTHLNILFPKDEDEFRTMVAMRVTESSAKFGGTHATEVAESYNRYYQTEAYKTSRPFPGIQHTINELKGRGYRLAVASNKSLGRIQAEIDHLQLEGLIDLFVTSEDTAERKPHPAPLLKAAEKLGLTPQGCAYIGDYEGDIMAAKAAGMLSVAALWGTIFLPDTLIAQQPDYAVERPIELLDVFRDNLHG
jgi:HAD superfamily hydrolase (TIGR01662 family)